MATLTDFYIKQNDTREAIQIICEKGDGTAEDLSVGGTATVKFIMASAAGAATKVDAAGSIVGSAANGVVQYQWASGNTDTAGTFLAEFQVTFGDGRIFTYPNTAYITIHIFPELGS